MNAFNKLTGFKLTPPGMERRVLRHMPRVFLLGTLLIGLPSLLARVLPWSGGEADVAMGIMSIDVVVVAVLVIHWIIVFTIATVAFLVMLMKGPAYVADAYAPVDVKEPGSAGRWGRL